MIKTIEDITKRIVEGYNPERIILFGSWAKQKSDVNSDLDLLVIKDTKERLAERRIQVERLLLDRATPLDIIVYTPWEIRYLFSLGSPFIGEIINEGKVIYVRKVTESWLKDADDELESASVLFEHEKYRGACYHSQQCVEKGLKALLLEKGVALEKIHDILGLLNKTKSLGWEISLSVEEAIFLNSIYKGKYPTEEGLLPYGDPTKEDSEKALLSAQELMNEIKEMIR